MIKSKVALFLIAPLLSAYLLAGCATSAQTGAAAMAGGLLGTTVAVLALTNSSLKVTVDMYAPTDDEREKMHLPHPPALIQSINDRRQAAVDPIQNPTAQNMKTVEKNLRPVMERIKNTINPLDYTITQLDRINQDIEKRGLTNQGYIDAQKTMEALQQAVVAQVKAWEDFDATMKANMQRLDDPIVLRTLAFQLSVLRESLVKSAGSRVVTAGYIDLLITQIEGALRLDLVEKAANESVKSKLNEEITSKFNITDNPVATDAERIAIVLDAARQLLGSTSNPENVNKRLRFLGISLDSQQLLALGSREAIASALTPSLARPNACEGASAVIALPACSSVAYDYTFGFSRATADYTSGPISNEVAQVLQAANRGLTIISEPGNAGRWRVSANAKSRGGAGNQNSIIYFENMALPVVKSSAFDPTKFVVAAGALYRQVFAASVAAFGAPLPATAGAPGGPDMQSSNIIATRARILNADKAAAAARQKILDTLKMTIDQQAKVKSGDWSKNQAAIVKAVQDAVQGAATQLETVAGTN